MNSEKNEYTKRKNKTNSLFRKGTEGENGLTTYWIEGQSLGLTEYEKLMFHHRISALAPSSVEEIQ